MRASASANSHSRSSPARPRSMHASLNVECVPYNSDTYTQNKRSHSHRNVTMSALVCARLSCVPTGCIHFFSHEPHQLRPFRVCKSGAAGPDSAALAAHKLVWKDCSSNGARYTSNPGRKAPPAEREREGSGAGVELLRAVVSDQAATDQAAKVGLRWRRIGLRQIRHAVWLLNCL